MFQRHYTDQGSLLWVIISTMRVCDVKKTLPFGWLCRDIHSLFSYHQPSRPFELKSSPRETCADRMIRITFAKIGFSLALPLVLVLILAFFRITAGPLTETIRWWQIRYMSDHERVMCWSSRSHYSGNRLFLFSLSIFPSHASGNRTPTLPAPNTGFWQLTNGEI